MLIVATLARRGSDDKEMLRTLIFKVEVKSSLTTYLHEAVMLAGEQCIRGERIVRIIEGGYQ